MGWSAQEELKKRQPKSTALGFCLV